MDQGYSKISFNYSTLSDTLESSCIVLVPHTLQFHAFTEVNLKMDAQINATWESDLLEGHFLKLGTTHGTHT